jgi:hypothetical protein
VIIQHCWLISLWLLPPPWTNGGETAEAPYWAGFGHLNAPPSRRRYPVCLQPTAELIQWGSMESLENIGPCWWIDYIDLTMHIWVTYVPMPIKCQPLRVTTLPFSVAHGYWVVHWRLAATVPPPRSPLDFQLETPGHIPMLLPWLVAAGCSWLQLGLTPPFPSVPSAIPWSPVLHPPWHQISSVDCVESESVDCWVLETEIGCMLHSNVQLYSKVAAKKNYGGAGYRWIHHSISYVDQSCSCWYKGQISRQLYIHCLRRHIVCWLFGTAAYSCNIDDQDIDQNSPSCVKHRNKATRWVLGSQVLLVGRNIGIISCLAFELTPGINAWLGSADTRDKCCSLGASVSNTRDERCDDNL